MKPENRKGMTIKMIKVDDRIPLEMYYQIASSFLKESDMSRKEKDFTNSYKWLLKFSSLVNDTIPSHKDYQHYSYSEKSLYTKRLLDAWIELKALAPIVERLTDDKCRTELVAVVNTQIQAKAKSSKSESSTFKNGKLQDKQQNGYPSGTQHEEKNSLKELPQLEKNGLSCQRQCQRFSANQSNKSEVFFMKQPECQGIEHWPSMSEDDQFKFFCDICAELKPLETSFLVEYCYHMFCSDCIVKYMTIKIPENLALITCPEPECVGVIDPQSCRSILSKETIEKWLTSLSESAIAPMEKYYCPFRDCSALLWDDGNCKSTIREAECPYCHRLFCVQCHTPWHVEMECKEFRSLNKWKSGIDDAELNQLVNDNRWKRCCKYYVEKISGCLKISCRCGFEFCYRCGSRWSPDHYNCQSYGMYVD